MDAKNALIIISVKDVELDILLQVEFVLEHQSVHHSVKLVIPLGVVLNAKLQVNYLILEGLIVSNVQDKIV